MQCQQLSRQRVIRHASIGKARPGHVCPARTPLPSARRCRMTVNAALPPNYGYVLGSVASTAAVLQWMAIRVALARRDSGVKYPKMYADGDDEVANKFNCTQRAHQNSLETAPVLLAMVCLLGLEHPITAAALGMLWNVGRVVYALGYSTGDPSKRGPGGIVSSLVYLGTMFATGYTGIKSLL